MHMASLTLLQGNVPIEGTLRLDRHETPTTVNLVALLSPHEGHEVQVVAYHFPVAGLDPAKPGGGSCLWEPGKCPYHNTSPTSLYSVKARGILARDEHGWAVGDLPLRLDTLRGHHAGIVLFPVPDLSASTPSTVTPEDMGNLSAYMEQVQGLLAQVRARRNGQG